LLVSACEEEVLAGPKLYFLSLRRNKVFLDQAIFAPAIVTTFFFWANFWEGHSWPTIVKRYKENIGETMKANYVLWPAANVINYKFMPVDLRILYISCVSLIWNVFLSHQQHRNPQKKAQ